MISFFNQTFTSVQEAPSNMKRKKLKHKDKNIVNKYQPVTGCLSNKWGKCKAHFPCKTFEHTKVDMNNGALNIKKGESMLNTVTAEVTYSSKLGSETPHRSEMAASFALESNIFQPFLLNILSFT
jgi:hypothetical protein